jgi:hypothetical protein
MTVPVAGAVRDVNVRVAACESVIDAGDVMDRRNGRSVRYPRARDHLAGLEVRGAGIQTRENALSCQLGF